MTTITKIHAGNLITNHKNTSPKRSIATYNGKRFIPNDVYAVGERYNLKRHFLFASKIGGRYIPIDLSNPVIDNAYEALAIKIAQNQLKGNTLLISMAEAATQMSYFILNKMIQVGFSGNIDIVNTTRYPTDAPIWLKVNESHSHAPEHFIHQIPNRLSHYDNIIVCDDEYTSGNMLKSLFIELNQSGIIDKTVNIYTVSFLDWRTQDDLKKIESINPNFVEYPITLLSGSFDFECTNPLLPTQDKTVKNTNPLLEKHEIPKDIWRLGKSLNIQPQQAIQCELNIDVNTVIQQLNKLQLSSCLFIANGENWLATYILAEKVKQHFKHLQVSIVSTARGNIFINDNISNKIVLNNTYGLDDVPNYLYNVLPHQFDRFIFCSETQYSPTLDFGKKVIYLNNVWIKDIK